MWRSPRTAGRYPGIVVIQEAFGVNSHIKKVTERIAAEGYVAIAPDIFHRESERMIPYSEMPKAIATMQRVVDSKAMDDVGAAIAHLKSQSNVKSGSIGVIGFCMGGRLTYLTAAHHANDIKAAVPYYGGGIPMGNPSPLSRTGEIKCPMYLFFGAKDQLIPMDHVGQIKTELTTKKVAFQMEDLSGSGPWFFLRRARQLPRGVGERCVGEDQVVLCAAFKVSNLVSAFIGERKGNRLSSPFFIFTLYIDRSR